MQELPTIENLAAHEGDSDLELLRGWVVGQRQADFTEIVRRHLGLVQGIARRQLDPTLAEDVSQQVFAILARKASSLTSLHSLSAWLYRVTMLQCQSTIRRRMRDRKTLEAAMEKARTADGRAPLADALPHLDAAMDSLSESDREVILLRYSEGLSFKDAARRTGRNEAAIRQQAGRAVEKLGALLARRGVSVPMAVLTAGLAVQLAGTSSSSAATIVSSTALVNASGLTGSTLAGITFLTMTLKQSLTVGAILAAIVLSVPLGWRASQIHGTRRSHAVAKGASTRDMSPDSVGAFDPAGKARTAHSRAPQALTEADRARMLNAIPGIFSAAMKETLTEWFERDAWVEARRTARLIGLSPDMETDLRNFLTSEYSKILESANFDDNENQDYASRYNARQARLDDWFAQRLTPAQEESRKSMKKAERAALSKQLAESAVSPYTANLDLTEEQKSRLVDAAAIKAARTLDEHNYNASVTMALSLTSYPSEGPIEVRSDDLVRSVLDRDQQELWNAVLERDRQFGKTTQNRVLTQILQQFQRVKMTQEEINDVLDSGK